MVSVAIRDHLCGVPPRVKLLAIASPGALFFIARPRWVWRY
jgi:hypothetical protein